MQFARVHAGQPPNDKIKKVRIIGAQVFSHCPGKKVSTITVSIILSVAAKQEFFPFFAGIADYRKPAAVKRRAFHNEDLSVTKNYRKSKSGVSRFSQKMKERGIIESND